MKPEGNHTFRMRRPTGAKSPGRATSQRGGAERKRRCVLGVQVWWWKPLVGGDWNMFYFSLYIGKSNPKHVLFFLVYWECHHPSWRTRIVERGRYTTNQNCLWHGIWVIFTEVSVSFRVWTWWCSVCEMTCLIGSTPFLYFLNVPVDSFIHIWFHLLLQSCPSAIADDVATAVSDNLIVISCIYIYRKRGIVRL